MFNYEKNITQRYDKEESFICPKCGEVAKTEEMAIRYQEVRDFIKILCPACLFHFKRLPLDSTEK